MSKISRSAAIKIVALLSLAAAASDARAQGSANEPMDVMSSVNTTALATSCQRSSSPGAADFCSGYILGVYDAMSGARLICPAETATTGQAIAIARKYLQDHPEKWGAHPSTVLLSGFRAVFPCRE